MILTKYLFVIIIIIIIHIITLSLSLPQIYVRFPPMITPRGAYTSCDLARQPSRVLAPNSGTARGTIGGVAEKYARAWSGDTTFFIHSQT